MKTLTLVLVVAISGLAVASVQFARRAASEKARADAEVVLLQKQDARVRELEKSYADLDRQLMQAQRAQMELSSQMAVPAAGIRPSQGPPSARVVVQESPVSALTPLNRPFMRGPMDSEAGRKFMRTQMRGSIRRLYEDASRVLNLSKEQSDKLVDLIADQQSRGFGESGQMPADRAGRQQAWLDLQAQNNKDIAALIGDAKMGDLKEYQQTLPQRSQVDVVSRQLEAAGLPMSADQRSDLVTAMVAESKANPRPTLVPGAAPDDVQKQMSDWQESYDKSVSDRAKQVLSSEQYERYHEYEAWMADMRKSLPPPGRGFHYSGAAGGTFTPPPGAAVTVGPILMSTDSVSTTTTVPASRQ